MDHFSYEYEIWYETNHNVIQSLYEVYVFYILELQAKRQNGILMSRLTTFKQTRKHYLLIGIVQEIGHSFVQFLI
jgi:hypothetical protein